MVVVLSCKHASCREQKDRCCTMIVVVRLNDVERSRRADAHNMIFGAPFVLAFSFAIGGSNLQHTNNLKMTTSPPPADTTIDFVNLPWNLNLPEQHSYLHITTDSDWTTEHYDPATDTGILLQDDVVLKSSYHDHPLQLSPATTSLNYGTTVWEGLKCYRTTDNDSSVVFRMDRNYQRMKFGAHRMGLPMPSQELFYRAIQRVVQANAHLIPPPNEPGVKLYIRPMLLGTGQQLGLHVSKQISFVVYVSPTGSYFKSATEGLHIHLETSCSRAARGGTGNVKCAGNYGTTLRPLLDAKQDGFHDNLYCELETLGEDNNVDSAVLQELSAANVFFVLKTGEIVTPSLERGTLLAGVTRESVLELIEEYSDELLAAMQESTSDSTITKVWASSRDITVGQVRQEAVEAFATGTAAELVPLARLATSKKDKYDLDVSFPHGKQLPGGPVTVALLNLLRQAMVGEKMQNRGWLRDPFGSVQEFIKN